MTIKSLMSVLIVSAVLLAGCSSGDDSSTGSSSDNPTTTHDSAAECAARSDLEDSIKKLTDPDVLSGGRDQIESALDDVKKNLDALARASKTGRQSDVDAVEDAVSDLQTAVSNVGNGSLTDDLQTVGNLIAKVGTTTGTLIADLVADC